MTARHFHASPAQQDYLRPAGWCLVACPACGAAIGKRYTDAMDETVAVHHERRELPVVDSRIMHFQDEIAIVVERFDRLLTAAGIRRVHQEDICQAMSILPANKYQNEGGPGNEEIVALLRTHSGEAREDVGTFIDSIALNWLIMGTDAHAKNYALLIGANARVRLAPLYDVASILPYTHIDAKRAKLSMKLGGEYRFSNIQVRHWRKMAEDNRLDPDNVIQRVDEFARQLPDHVTETRSRTKREGVNHPLVDRLARRLTARAAACRRIFR